MADVRVKKKPAGKAKRSGNLKILPEEENRMLVAESVALSDHMQKREVEVKEVIKAEEHSVSALEEVKRRYDLQKLSAKTLAGETTRHYKATQQHLTQEIADVESQLQELEDIFTARRLSLARVSENTRTEVNHSKREADVAQQSLDATVDEFRRMLITLLGKTEDVANNFEEGRLGFSTQEVSQGFIMKLASITQRYRLEEFWDENIEDMSSHEHE